MRKKVDSRVRGLLEHCVATRQRGAYAACMRTRSADQLQMQLLVVKASRTGDMGRLGRRQQMGCVC